MKNKLILIGLIPLTRGLTQVLSEVFQAPSWPNCDALDACLCSLQLGSQVVEPIDRMTGDWPSVDRTSGYKTWKVWSKNSTSKGIQITYQDGYILGTGARKDQNVQMSVAVPGTQIQPVSVKIRTSTALSKATLTWQPYVCKLWVTFSDSSVLTD